MSYDYSSSDNKRLELPNPYRLQNLWLLLAAVLLVAAGVLCLWWARDALLAQAASLGIAPALAGLALVAAGLWSASIAARRLRFYFGRGRPRPLAPELPPDTTGGSPAADRYKDMLRQGGITYPEPQGALEGLLYHLVPQLITAPLEVQALAQRHFFNLCAVLLTIASFTLSWTVFGTETTRPWIGVMYFVFGVVFLFKPLLTDRHARLSIAWVAGIVAATILLPVAVLLAGPHLPQLGGFTLASQTTVMLATALVAVLLLAAAVRAQVGESPKAEASCEQVRLSMNAPPSLLLDELDRIMQSQWTERIPNRRYARLLPVIAPDRSAGPFAGELLEETQPMPRAGATAGTLSAAVSGPQRWLVALDGYATLLVAVAACLVLYFVHGFDVTASWSDNRLSLVGVSTILLLVSAFCLRSSATLWGRFDFESVLVWVEVAGTYQKARVGTGNQFSSRINTDTEIVRTEAMTLRVWRARIESVTFGKDGDRQVTAMFSTDSEAHTLAGALVDFAQQQSVLVSPGSAEDERRLAALAAGEEALVGKPAAQIHHDLQALAALGGTPSPEIPADGTAPARRFCPMCGAGVPAGARFCPSCGAALPAEGETPRS